MSIARCGSSSKRDLPLMRHLLYLISGEIMNNFFGTFWIFCERLRMSGNGFGNLLKNFNLRTTLVNHSRKKIRCNRNEVRI